MRGRRAPGVTRSSGRPRRWGGTASGGRPGGPCPEPPALVCLGGRQFPGFSSLSPNPDCAAGPGGRQQLPLTRSPKETSAHSQDGPRAPPPGFNPQCPAVPGRHARPTPRRAAVPAHLAGCLLPRVLRPPSTGPPLLRRGSHPAGEEAPSLISSSPELARRVMPPRRAVRGFHRGEEGAGLPDPATQSTRSSDNSNDNVIQMKR